MWHENALTWNFGALTKKRSLWAAGALVALALAAWPGLLWAQTPDENQAAEAAPPAEAEFISGDEAGQGEDIAPAEGPVFEVLEVTTGSGSKRQPEDQPAMRIEIMDLAPKSPEAAAEAALAEADPALTPAEREAQARKAALDTALGLWHSQTLKEYTYDIPSLLDPFMPIREVRGKPENAAEFSDPVDLSSLPPILRLELNQLRLVAITTRTGAAGVSLASFEDGAGVSYILRQGDRIGRRQGRITDITPYMVAVEEPSPAPGAPPRVTEIKLSQTDTSGLTRLGGQADEIFESPPEVSEMGGEGF